MSQIAFHPWHSTSTSLPRDWETVLLYGPRLGVSCGRRATCEQGWFWLVDGGACGKDVVTHWMPLPAPPPTEPKRLIEVLAEEKEA